MKATDESPPERCSPWRGIFSAPFSQHVPVFVLAALVVCLTARAGFFDDDSVISLWREQAAASGSVWHYCTVNFSDFIKYQGRFVPVFSFGILPLLVQIGDKLWAYRIYFSLIYAFSFLILYRGLWSLLGRRVNAALVLLAFVANIQLQNYHDSYTSYFAYLPLVSAFIIAAIAEFDLLVSSAAENRPLATKTLLRHIFWVALALSTWELAIVIAGISVVQVVSATMTWRRRRPLLALPLAWGGLFVFLNLALKHASTNTGTVVAVASGGGIAHAYGVQLRGTFPFSLGDVACPIDPSWRGFAQTPLLAIFLFAAVGFVLFRSVRCTEMVKTNRIVSLSAQSLFLVLAPPTLTAITAKYQRELQPGMAYLQVFLQSLGLSMLLVIGLMLLEGRARKACRLVYAVAIVGLVSIFALHWSRNEAVIALRNAYWQKPREVAAKALETVAGASDATEIAVARDYLQRWESKDFSSRHVGRPLSFTAGVGSPVDKARIYLDYSGCIPSPSPGYAWAGILKSSARLPSDNVFVVTRPLHATAPIQLEYTTVADSVPSVQRREVTAATDVADEYAIIRDPSPVQPNSVRLVVSH